VWLGSCQVFDSGNRSAERVEPDTTLVWVGLGMKPLVAEEMEFGRW
jgi:hypothetical protein